MNALTLMKIAILSVPVFFLLTACSPSAETEEWQEAMRAEIATLRQNQSKIEKEVTDLKRRMATLSTAAVPGKSFKPAVIGVRGAASVGAEQAPLTMFWYTDYRCTDCASYSTTMLERILAAYVETGKLRVVMREFPGSDQRRGALRAAKAAVCAGRQGKYLEMHDWMFATRDGAEDEDLKSYIERLGLDQEVFQTCLLGPEVEKRIKSDVREAQEAGVENAPGFLLGITNPENPDRVRVNRYIAGAEPFEVFQAAIEEALAKVGKKG